MIYVSTIVFIAEIIGFMFGIYAIYWLISYPFRKRKAKKIEEYNKRLIESAKYTRSKVYDQDGNVIADFTDDKNGKKEES